MDAISVFGGAYGRLSRRGGVVGLVYPRGGGNGTASLYWWGRLGEWVSPFLVLAVLAVVGYAQGLAAMDRLVTAKGNEACVGWMAYFRECGEETTFLSPFVRARFESVALVWVARLAWHFFFALVLGEKGLRDVTGTAIHVAFSVVFSALFRWLGGDSLAFLLDAYGLVLFVSLMGVREDVVFSYYGTLVLYTFWPLATCPPVVFSSAVLVVVRVWFGFVRVDEEVERTDWDEFIRPPAVADRRLLHRLATVQPGESEEWHDVKLLAVEGDRWLKLYLARYVASRGGTRGRISELEQRLQSDAAMSGVMKVRFPGYIDRPVSCQGKAAATIFEAFVAVCAKALVSDETSSVRFFSDVMRVFSEVHGVDISVEPFAPHLGKGKLEKVEAESVVECEEAGAVTPDSTFYDVD